MKKRNLANTLLFIILTVLLFVYTIYTKAIQTAEYSAADLINVVFLGLMSGTVIYINQKYLRKANMLINGLCRSAEELKDGKDWKQLDLQEQRMQQAFDSYITEMQRLENSANDAVACDIQDYVNLSLINQIISKNICESISGLMTGIGILGTFLGLTIGLRNFDTDYEAMQNSIMSLIGGIKTAFLTSIYGVIYSITFTWIYRHIYHDTVDSLEKFYNMFSSYAVPDSQNDINNRLVHAQEQQAANIKIFADTVSEVMGSHFQKSIDSLNRGIDDFMAKAIMNQEDKLRLIVKEYLTIMNTEVLGGQLEELRNVLEEINTYERKNIKILCKIIEDIQKRDSAVIEASDTLTHFSEELKNYLLYIQQYQQNAASLNEQLAEGNKLLSETTERGIDVNTKSLLAIQEIQDNIKTFTAAVDTGLNRMTTSLQEFETVNIAHADAIKEIYSEATEIVKQTESDTKRAFDTYMASAVSVQQKYEAIAEEQKNYLTESVSAVQKNAEKLAFIFEKLSEQQKTHLEALTTLSQENSQVFMEELREQQKAEHMAACQQLADISDGLQKVSEQMQKNYIQLTAEMESGLHRSFDELDSAAAGVTYRFADVLKEMTEASESFPKAIYQSEKVLVQERTDIRKQLNQMNCQLASLLELLEHNTKTINETQIIGENSERHDKLSQLASLLILLIQQRNEEK